MEEIVKIVGIGLIAMVLIIIIKQYRQEFAIYVSLIAGTLILVLVMDKFTSIIELLKQICNESGLNTKFLGVLLKMTGIAFLAEFAISICKDAGETALANKVELGSKAIVISMSIPIIHNLLEIILNLMPT